MNQPQPAPLDLDAIQARHAAATGGNWRYEAYAGLGEHGVLGAADIPIGRLDFGDGDQADADRDFVLNAHQDVTALLARVRQLETELATERAVAESNQRAARLLAEDVKQLTAEATAEPELPVLSGWAADMAGAGLEPYDGALTLDGDDRPFLRAHFAFGPEVPEAARAGFVTEIGRIILDEL
ncbi:hypothetical protein [Kitasatospora sp. NPDC127116]|uniref:hypothetical protein n=1 Tax=Kitasatospora sp. NPDC127116 TaxID=3345367 RepID=UPI0036333CB2